MLSECVSRLAAYIKINTTNIYTYLIFIKYKLCLHENKY